MRQIFLCLFVLCLGLNVFSQENSPQGNQQAMSLEQVVWHALENNFGQQSLLLSKMSAEASYEQSKIQKLPGLSASASQNFSDSKGQPFSSSGNYSLSTSMTLYNGGILTKTIEQNKLQIEKAQAQILQAENQLTIRVIEAFLSALMNEEMLKYQKEVLKTSNENLKQGEENFKAGKILESDYLMLEAQQASDRFNLYNTEINYKNSILSVKNLLSLEPEKALAIIPPDTSKVYDLADLPELEYFMEVSLAWFPDLEIDRHNINLATLNVEMARAGNLPTVSLNGSLGTGYNSTGGGFGSQLEDRFSEQIGLSLNIPLFNRNQTKTKILQSKYSLQQAELSAKQKELDVKQTLEQEYRNVGAAFNKYLAGRTREKAYSENFRVYAEQYKAGSITTVEMLQQQTNYLNTLNEFLQNKYSFILNRKILDVYMGMPVQL